MDNTHEIVSNDKGKSSVWVHFGFRKRKKDSFIDQSSAVCRHCSTTVKLSGGTTNMSQHMRRHHSTLFGDTDGPAPKKAATTSATASAAAAVPTVLRLNKQNFSTSKESAVLISEPISDSERAKDLTNHIYNL